MKAKLKRGYLKKLREFDKETVRDLCVGMLMGDSQSTELWNKYGYEVEFIINKK